MTSALERRHRSLGVPTTELDIALAGGNSSSAGEAIKNFTVKLEPGERYIAIVSGVLEPQAFSGNPEGRSTALALLLKEDIRESSVGETRLDLVVAHGVTDAPAITVAARGIDVLVEEARYAEITDYVSLPAAQMTLDIAESGKSEDVLFSFDADFSSYGGESGILLASGCLDPGSNQGGEDFALILAMPDGQVRKLVPSQVTGIAEPMSSVPEEFSLSQNYPNPFNPSTSIEFTIPSAQSVTLKVYDVRGNEVATLVNKRLNAGSYQVQFNAEQLASGTYFYRLKTADAVLTRKSTLMK